MTVYFKATRPKEAKSMTQENPSKTSDIATLARDAGVLTFRALRRANVSRKIRWHGDADEWSGADWSNAMAGECGEACNIVKKLRRHETHTGTSYNTPELEALLPMLADELADVVTYADLLADKYGIDLDRAVREKFNRVSEAQGFPEWL
jgi:NTP pyrophosphatase (non-canonical NTP hydrolase)